MIKSIFLLLSISTFVFSRDTSSLISRLYGSQGSSPVVIVLDGKTLQTVADRARSSDSLEDTDDGSLPYILFQLAQLQNRYSKQADKLQKKNRQLGDRKERNRLYRPRNTVQTYQLKPNSLTNRIVQGNNQGLWKQRNRLDRDDRLRANDFSDSRLNRLDRLRDDLDRLEQTTAKSPIVKELLSLRNSLRCGARNECEDECSEKYKGKKKNTCQNKCEKKFQCEVTTPDPCEQDECAQSDECAASNQCEGSTKGVTMDDK